MTSAMDSKILSRLQSARERYSNSGREYVNFLLYGNFGTGKTHALSTCPRPIFVDCFDPGGTKTAVLQPLISSGDLIVDNRWEEDSWNDPRAYMEWEREMAAREQEGFFSAIGTYALDSLTRWADSMMWEILRRGTPGKGTRKGKQPELQDYLIQQLTAVDWLGRMMSYPCHVVCTGHIGLLKDEINGGVETGLLLAGKLSDKVPLIFDEKYITVAKDSHAGVEYRFQTKNDGKYKAETRMGGGKFQMFEEPNVRALLKRAGKAWEDKPKIIG